jgi:putative ABC transport system permease protein
MLRITLKGVRGHVLRFLLTVASVMLGTALIAGTYVLTDSINATFDKIFDQVAAGVDVSVRGAKIGQSTVVGGGETREQLPITLVDRLRAVDGVKRAEPDLQGSIILVGKDGTAVRNGGAPTLAFAYYQDDPTLHLVQGRAPRGPNEVAVESSTLKLSKLSVGAHTQAVVGNHPEAVTVVGEVKFDAAIAGATMVVVDGATARATFAPDGRVPSFSVVAEPGVSQATLRDRIAKVLPAQAEAVTGQQAAAEGKKSLHEQLGFISTFLFVFAGVSVFVGAFIILNTFFILVTQRTKELALLRALGATKAQLVRMVLSEAAVLGFAGALGGLGAGIGLAKGLQALFGVVGLDISAGLPVQTRTVVVTLLVGVVVCVLAATIPALRAARIAPVAAMRDDIAVTPLRLGRWAVVGGSLLAAGVALTVPAVTRTDVSWLMFTGGVICLVIGALVISPVASRPVIHVVAAPFVLVSGTVGRLARGNALRAPLRTTITAAALMIGLTLIAGISVVAQSTKASVADLIDRQLTADFVLNGGQAPFPTTVADGARKLAGVQAVAQIGFLPVQIGADQLVATAGDATGIADNVKVDVTSGSLAALDSGEVLVNTTAAKDHGWKVGSTISATVGSLPQQTLTVGGVYRDNQVLSGSMLAPMSLYTRAIPAAQQGDFYDYVKAVPGTDLASLRTRLTELVKPYLVVSVQDGSQFTSDQASQVNNLLMIIYVLLALSVVIAVLGIVNTLALSVFERTREIGLLRAVGLTRGQLSRSITIEAVATAVFGAVLGTALGLGLGIALRRGLVDSGLEVLSIPWGTLVGLLVAAAFAGVVAAVLPAIRAVRLDVLRAVTTE